MEISGYCKQNNQGQAVFLVECPFPLTYRVIRMMRCFRANFMSRISPKIVTLEASHLHCKGWQQAAAWERRTDSIVQVTLQSARLPTAPQRDTFHLQPVMLCSIPKSRAANQAQYQSTAARSLHHPSQSEVQNRELPNKHSR
jgi:hypothetical protein